MRKTVLALSFLLTGVVVATSTFSCGGGDTVTGTGEGGLSATCDPGESQECSGPSDCVGGQVCNADGTEWTECACQNDAGEVDVDGSLIPINGKGGSAGHGGTSGKGGGGTTGKGGGGSDGSSGTAGKGGGGSDGSSGTAGKGGGGTAGKGGGGTAGKGGGGSSGSSGSSGKGGGGSSGSSGKGGGGSDGTSGSSGKGGGGSGGSSGYAFRESAPRVDRSHSFALASGASETTPFIWHDAPGLAPPADLWVKAEGRAVLQVSSIGTHPFARAGLDLVPIQPDVLYNIVINRMDDTVNVTLVRADTGPVLQTHVHVDDSRTAENEATAEVVLPGTIWRASVSVE
jgi:hypothetical protein